MLENTVKVLSLLEGNKFNGSSDIAILSTCADLVFSDNRGFWTKGSKDRESLLAMLGNKFQLNTSSTLDQQNLIKFCQGLLILSLSLINGLGRSPISLQKEKTLNVNFPSKSLWIKLTPGKFDLEMNKLVQEFKKAFFGVAGDASLGRTDLLVIKEALKETNNRLTREKQFLEKLANKPGVLFEEKLSENSFSSGLFLLLSALPAEILNRMLIDIGSYLPPELEDYTEDRFQINVRNYLTGSTVDIHELFKKVRLLLKLYFGQQRQIIAIIVKEKVKAFFQEVLSTDNIKKEMQDHLKKTATNQFELRLKILEGLVKLL